MPDIAARVRSLSAAAFRLRRAAPPRPGPLPVFALALFTDDRRQTDLPGLLAELPETPHIPPLAVIFRHDGLVPDDRLALATTARDLVKARGHIFLMARGSLEGADGCHGASAPKDGFSSRPVHDLGEGHIARTAGADLAFISPVFATASHPGAPALGPARASALARQIRLPAFALGGMTARTAKRLEGLPFYGMGVIGAWSG